MYPTYSLLTEAMQSVGVYPSLMKDVWSEDSWLPEHLTDIKLED